MTKTLLILAGGMGSRYGGLKQIDGFGPHDESILEYSIYDAIRAGFTEVVIVLRRDFQDKFDAKFADTFGQHIGVQYVYQDMDVIRFGGTDGSHREKPRGTGHAILSAKEVISGPFAVINADDFYGSPAFYQMSQALETVQANDCIIVAYQLDRTLSPYGGVNRGACKVSPTGYLEEVVEHLGIERNDAGVLMGHLGIPLKDDTIVSMGFWGFGANYMNIIEQEFALFLAQYATETKKEFFIPSVVDTAIHTGISICKASVTDSVWMGVSNKEDKPGVQQLLQSLISQGEYPQHLRS